ncbi:MAG: TIGR01440 family protein [Bacillota bacterium]
MDFQKIALEVKQAAEGLLKEASLRPGQILVVGGSTSEVLGRRIGSASNLEVAQVILRELVQAVRQAQVFLAVQCCEHLNRALVIERAAQEKYLLEEVTVVPVPGAGGALAAFAMDLLEDAVVVEKLAAHAGMDIGDTLIGMHLRPVAVPVRLPVKSIGLAHLTLAKTRPKLVGGHRAVYTRVQPGCTPGEQKG